MVTDAECLHEVCFTDKLVRVHNRVHNQMRFLCVLTAAPFESR